MMDCTKCRDNKNVLCFAIKIDFTLMKLSTAQLPERSQFLHNNVNITNKVTSWY